MNLEIRNRDDLINIFKVISWLDSRRWNKKDNYNFINFFRSDLTNYEKILTPWICYITDRQMPFETVWDKGGYVFSELVYEYSRNGISPQQILNNHYEKFIDKEGKKRFRFKSKDGEVTFASRYVTNDCQNILQTLEVLNNQRYERNIVAFIADITQKFQHKNGLLIRVTCGLHLLTYQLENKKANSKKIIEILNDDEKFEKKFKQFKKTSTNGKKRLWCCVRDYKKGLYNEIFNDALKESTNNNSTTLINVWNKLPMNQIELP